MSAYHIEVFDGTRWVRAAGSCVPKLYGEGYIQAHRDSPGPRLALRLVRDDGKVICEAPALKDASIGAVAGWPTAGQYLRAAKRAVEHAAKARYPDILPQSFELRLRTIQYAISSLLEDMRTPE